ncbi:MAG: ATP-binding protein [Desulfobacterales bacterium]|nr:MAG: ATP-binding protein [Desulfobacterales bacterium]
MPGHPDPTTSAGGTRVLNREDDRYFPFAAIVGQEAMKTALVLNAVNPEIGGVLIRGQSGTAKSTAVRGLTALLPDVQVVADCPFQCDPEDHRLQCAVCRERIAQGEPLPVIARPRRLVNLPLNATEDRVAGTLDITRALKEGVKALDPGLLADANRGILYIDEINLLDDHIVDILLDAAALGVNVVEREGLSVSHPAQFLLIGTMNPEEGELRPQIADRIGLEVEVAALTDKAQRAEVLKRRESFLAREASDFVKHYRPLQDQLRHTIQLAMARLPHVTVPANLYEAIAALTVKFEVLSHRADITILQCAKAITAVEGRSRVEASDILEAAKLALGHRLPHDPFVAGPALDPIALRRQLEKILDTEIELKKKPLTPTVNP